MVELFIDLVELFILIFNIAFLPVGSSILSQLRGAHCGHRLVRQRQPIQYKHSFPQHPGIFCAERYRAYAMDCGSAEQE